MPFAQLTLFCLLIFFNPLGFALDKADLLPPAQAFKVSAAALTDNKLEVTWTIADGYSVYRKNLRLRSKHPSVSIGALNFPPAEIKRDGPLGDIEHYRKRFSVTAPLTGNLGLASLPFEVSYQGCSDQGVCYPPQKLAFDVPLPAPKPAPSLAADADPLAKLLKTTGLSFGQQQELLPPDQAFQFFAETKDAHTLRVSWQIAENYYLYRDKIKLELSASPSVRLAAYTPPNGSPKPASDEAGGQTEIYRGSVAFNVPLSRTGDGPETVKLTAGYQGCADSGVCYPPMTQTVALALPAASLSPPAIGAPVSEQDRIANALHKDGFWATLLSFLGFGLLLSLTPCIFPMVPILSGIIVGHGRTVTTLRAFLLSLSYVLASAFTYTVFGVLAALFGGNLQATFQQPWIIALFSGVFVLLALSMFGFYHLELPKFLQAKLHDSSEKHRDGSLWGAAIMGALSSLIVGPCVAAPLAGALIYIGKTGDVLLGGSALFVMGLGMGVPLLLLGASAGKLLPKAGDWLNATNAVFGVIMLAVAVWMLSRIIPPTVTMLLYAMLLILPSVYLRAIDPLPEHSSGWQKLCKGVGLMMLAYGLLLLIGVGMGNGNPLKPLQGLAVAQAGTQTRHDEGLPFQPVTNLAELEQKIAKASASNKPVMLDFYADWCVSCKEMEAFTFTDAEVKRFLQDFVLLRADVTGNSADDQALLHRFGLIGPPGVLFFGRDGQEQTPLRVIGYQDATTFLATLKQLTL